MSPTVTFQTPQDAGKRAVLQAAVESAIVPIDQRESADKPIEKERPAEIAQILEHPIENRNSSGLKKLADYFKSLDEDYAADLSSLSQRVGERDQFVNQLPKVMVMDTRNEKRETFILAGGIYDKPGESVTPGVPQSLPPLPPHVQADRAGLAEWLVRDENPLTARVIVNRYWQLFFR